MLYHYRYIVCHSRRPVHIIVTCTTADHTNQDNDANIYCSRSGTCYYCTNNNGDISYVKSNSNMHGLESPTSSILARTTRPSDAKVGSLHTSLHAGNEKKGCRVKLNCKVLRMLSTEHRPTTKLWRTVQNYEGDGGKHLKWPTRGLQQRR